MTAVRSIRATNDATPSPNFCTSHYLFYLLEG